MSAALGRRTAARYQRSTVARKLRQVRAFVSATARLRGRRTAVPVRYRWFRLRTIGPVPEPVPQFAMPEPGGHPPRPHDLAVVAGDTELTPEIVDALVECERTSVPTLLIATAREHLYSELATVCTDLATSDQDIYAAALPKIGAERTHLLPDDPDDARGWLRALISLR